MDRGVTYTSVGMAGRLALLVAILLLTAGGCNASYDILVVEENPNGTYLLFPKGTPVAVGEIYRIVAPVGGTAGHDVDATARARLRRVLGKVRVIAIAKESRALVEVLEGTVSGGASAEKAD